MIMNVVKFSVYRSNGTLQSVSAYSLVLLVVYV